MANEMGESSLPESVDEQLKSFKVGITSQGFFSIPLLATMEKRMFERRGLSVEIVDTKGKVSLDQLDTGDLDISASPPEATIQRIESGISNVKIVSGFIGDLVLEVIAKPEFRKIEDLKGAVFGTIPADGGTKFLFEDMARAHGLEPSDYTVELVGGAPARWQALQDGKIDAGLLPPPVSFIAEDIGFANLGRSFDYYPEYQFGVYAANVERGAEDRERLVDFLHALMIGTKWTFAPENKDEVIALAKDRLGLDPKYAARAWDLFHDRQIMAWNLSINRTGLEKVMELMMRSAQLPQNLAIDVENYLCLEFLDTARARLDD